MSHAYEVALSRLEYLSQVVPVLRPHSHLYESTVEEANELKSWLDNQHDSVSPEPEE